MLSSGRCPHCSTRMPRAGTRCSVCGAPVSARRLDRSADLVGARAGPLPSSEERQSHCPDGDGSGPPRAA